MSVKHLLDLAATDGRFVSEGNFTVELSKAQDKLQQYQLEEPGRYVLSLLANANSAGARHVWITKKDNGILFCHDGETVSAAELQEIFERIEIGAAASKTYLTELGMAIQAARALKPGRLIYESGDRSTGVLFVLDGNTAKIQQMTGLPDRQGVHTSATNRFYLHGRSSSFWNRLLGREDRETEEHLLHRFGRFSPCQIHWNGVPLPAPTLGGWTRSARLDGETRLPKIELIGQQRSRLDNPGSFSGYLGFGSTPGAWLIINDGVRFQIPVPNSAPPTSRVLAFTTGLKKDLSGQKLVEDANFNLLLSALEAKLTELAERR